MAEGHLHLAIVMFAVMSVLDQYLENTQFLEFCANCSDSILKSEHNIFYRRLPQMISHHQERISLEWQRQIFMHRSAAYLFLGLFECSLLFDRGADIPFG